MSRQFLGDVATTMAQRTTKEWLAAFDWATVPAGPCQSVDQLADDPQVLANELVAGLEHPVAGSISMVGPVVRMAGTPATARYASPTIGQHNDEILAEVRYFEAEIADLRSSGVLYSPATDDSRT